MYLKSLEINGFKSFANKSALEFSTPISAIVGPNGSGKSNVAESFKFVLGEQSIKSLRGKKGSDLIYNGESGKKNRAAVKVTFDNKDRKLGIEFDEVSLERVVNRDGTNEYFINGSPARLKDIAEMLAKAHVGSSGHHIISQGEADRMLNVNQKDRRAMLEDALGLRVYQYKKAESERKLEKTEENVKEVQLLRREIAPHIKFLQKHVEKIEKSKELKATLQAQYNEYLKREEIYLQNSKERIEGQIAAPKNELISIESRIVELRKTIDDSKQKSADNDDLMKLEDKNRSIKDEVQEINRKLGAKDGEIASLRRLIEKEQKRLEDEENIQVRMSDVKSKFAEIESEISGAENTDDISIIRETFQKIRGIFQNFLSQYKNENTSEALSELKNDVSSLETERKTLEDSLNQLKAQENEIEQQIRELRQKIEQEKEGYMDAEREMFEVLTKKGELESQIRILQNDLTQIDRDKEEFNRELTEGGALLGTSISQYREQSFDVNEVLSEDRTKQQQRRKELEKNKIRLEEMGTANADDIMKEYEEVTQRDAFLLREIEDLEKTSAKLKEMIGDLEETIEKKFKAGVSKINEEFNKYFQILFNGGEASLKVVTEEIPENLETGQPAETREGIEIKVSLPRKKIKGLMMLSGGERALTSIALLFAMSAVNPPPFIILDETDAALDEANSRKYGDMIESLSEQSQLILITHNRETMSRAGVLYGVTMGGDGVSKLLSIQFDEAVEVAK